MPLTCTRSKVNLDEEAIGVSMHRFAAEIFPWHRSIMGDGVRQTLEAIQQRIPVEVKGIASGTEVFGWIVPDEWKIRDAYVADHQNNRVIDYRQSNLHVVNHSQPIDGRMSWDELKSHLYTLPERPDWIPYRTAYFQERWGFCLSQTDFDRLDALGNRSYRVCIDADFHPGELNYGELLLPGASDREFLFSTHICHPSLANDNLSSIVVMTELARILSLQEDRSITFRFLFIPATIGAIAWLASNQKELERIVGGLVLSNLGDDGEFTYKRSRRGNSLIDAIASALQQDVEGHPPIQLRDFEPFGYDERQFCSPGFNLPMGRFSRTPHGEFPEYHTSADNLDFIHPQALAESLQILLHVAQRVQQPFDSPKAQEIVGEGIRYRSTHPYCEPPLAKHGLHQGYGWSDNKPLQSAVMWVLNLSDGVHGITDISAHSKLPLSLIEQAAQRLLECGLLEELK